MLLLLVRHGIAEDRGGKPDALRELTEEGRRKMEKAYPILANLLANRTVRIISSPLIRARQTAEVLERSLSVRMETAEWVALGETRELVLAMKHTKEDVLIVVGHEPTLSDWCERLGFSVGWMKKGSAAFFDMGSGRGFIGYLRVRDMVEEKTVPLSERFSERIVLDKGQRRGYHKTNADEEE